VPPCTIFGGTFIFIFVKIAFMKNGLLVWNILLTIVAGYLLFVHFGAKKTSESFTQKIESRDTAMLNRPFRIAYFEMDSVENNFQMVKDIKAEINKKEETINIQLEKLDKEYKTKVNAYQSQAQSMTPGQTEAATQEIMRMQEDMKTTKQALDQDYNDFVFRRQKDVKTRIEEFLNIYNKTKNYSYIVSYEQGIFYYKDTAYNITEDVIKGLNELYKTKKS
jgi:outer membrane protein